MERAGSLSLEGGLLKSWASQPQWKAALMFGVGPSAPWSLSWLFKRGGSVYIVLLPLGFQGGRAGH